MRVALAQYPITFCGNLPAWQAHTDAWVAAASRQGAQILVFPEYGSLELTSIFAQETYGHLMTALIALERCYNDFVAQYTQLAARYGVVIVAPSYPVPAVDLSVNRTLVFSPTRGLVGHQDKWHMTRFEEETWRISPPERFTLTVFQTDWGAFGIQTCFDVEFPIGSALLTRAGAALIVAPSCTETAQGSARVHIGARARALENQCFVAVSAVVGTAEWSPAVDINYGHAAVYAPPDGDFPADGILATAEPQRPIWLVADLNPDDLAQVRTQGQVFNLREHFRTQYAFKEGTVRVHTVQV